MKAHWAKKITLFGAAFQSCENSQCSPFRHAPWEKNLQRTLEEWENTRWSLSSEVLTYTHRNKLINS
jgi:hypothetical protein